MLSRITPWAEGKWMRGNGTKLMACWSTSHVHHCFSPWPPTAWLYLVHELYIWWRHAHKSCLPRLILGIRDIIIRYFQTVVCVLFIHLQLCCLVSHISAFDPGLVKVHSPSVWLHQFPWSHQELSLFSLIYIFRYSPQVGITVCHKVPLTLNISSSICSFFNFHHCWV